MKRIHFICIIFSLERPVAKAICSSVSPIAFICRAISIERSSRPFSIPSSQFLAQFLSQFLAQFLSQFLLPFLVQFLLPFPDSYLPDILRLYLSRRGFSCVLPTPCVCRCLFVVYGKGIYAQTFTCLYKSGSRSLFADIASLQKFDPFVEWSLRHLVEVVNPQHVILREHISCAFPLHYVQFLFPEELLVLSYRQLQFIVRLVHTAEFRPACDTRSPCPVRVQSIRYLPNTPFLPGRKVCPVRYTPLWLSTRRTAFCGSTTVRGCSATSIMQSSPFSLSASMSTRLYLSSSVFLVAFAFEESVYFEFHSDQLRQESLQYGVVSLVAQQAFHCPVESDIIFSVLYHVNR